MPLVYPSLPFTELEPINQQCPREQQQKYNSDDNNDYNIT
jgi:hypothetical protein